LEKGACFGVKDIGKPCTGKLYARFDEGGLGLPALYSTQTLMVLLDISGASIYVLDLLDLATTYAMVVRGEFQVQLPATGLSHI